MELDLEARGPRQPGPHVHLGTTTWEETVAVPPAVVGVETAGAVIEPAGESRS